jgi:cation-transporting ATPase F
VAKQRLLKFGENRLSAARGPGALRRFLSQFQQPLVYILLAAGGRDGRGCASGWTPAVILGVVLMNAVVGFIQEQRAEQALAALQRLVRTEAAVRRGRAAAAYPGRGARPRRHRPFASGAIRCLPTCGCSR